MKYVSIERFGDIVIIISQGYDDIELSAAINTLLQL